MDDESRKFDWHDVATTEYSKDTEESYADSDIAEEELALGADENSASNESRSVLDLPNEDSDEGDLFRGNRRLNPGSAAAITTAVAAFLVFVISFTIGASDGSIGGGYLMIFGVINSVVVLFVGTIISVIISANRSRKWRKEGRKTTDEGAFIVRNNNNPEQSPVLGAKQSFAPNENRSVLDRSDKKRLPGPVVGLIVFIVMIIIMIATAFICLMMLSSRANKEIEKLDKVFDDAKTRNNGEMDDY